MKALLWWANSFIYKQFQNIHIIWIEKPYHHPLVGVVDFNEVNQHMADTIKISSDYYSIMFKNFPNNKFKYGRKFIDFQDGSLICMSPNQVIEIDGDE